MSPFYLTSGEPKGGGGVRTRKRLMRTFKLARHRFGQPWLFVSSGNAKGKGALPPPFRRPCADTPFASVRSLPLPFDTHAYMRTNDAYATYKPFVTRRMCIYENYGFCEEFFINFSKELSKKNRKFNNLWIFWEIWKILEKIGNLMWQSVQVCLCISNIFITINFASECHNSEIYVNSFSFCNVTFGKFTVNNSVIIISYLLCFLYIFP